MVHSCGFLCELLCRFGIVCVVFNIPERVTSLCLWALSEIFLVFLVFLGGDG